MSYDPIPEKVEDFLAIDVASGLFGDRLDQARDVSVQLGDSPGAVVTVGGFGIDVKKRLVDKSNLSRGEHEAVEALSKKIRPIIFPLLDAMG